MISQLQGSCAKALIQRLLIVLPLAAVLTALIFIFPVLQAIIVNIADFKTPLISFWDSQAPFLAIWAFGIFWVPALILNANTVIRYSGLLIALMIAFYVQANIFVWEYGVVDGSFFDYSGKLSIATMELLFWLILIGGGVYWARRLFSYRWQIISILLAMQVVNLATTSGASRFVEHVAAASPVIPSEVERAKKTADTSAFSTEKNVVIWISDGLQSNVAEEILIESPQLSRQLNGFTFFSDAMGQYRQTKIAIPALLAGQIYDGQMGYAEYINTHVPRYNIGRLIAAENVSTMMIAGEDFCAGFVQCSRRWHLTPNPGTSGDEELLANTINISFFRVVPHVFKPIIFDGVTGVGQTVRVELAGMHLSRNTQTNDAYFYRWLTKKLHVGDASPTLKVFISTTSHHPYRVGKNCRMESSESKIEAMKKQYFCNISLFTDFIGKLKQLGVYDNTMIIWVADHGSRQKFADIGSGKYATEISEASVTFAVKPFGKSNTPLQYSDAPVQLVDVAPTVLDAFGLPYNHTQGMPVFQVPPGNRSRRYFSTSAPWRSKAIEVSGYEVVGPRLDPENWTPSHKFKIENHN